MKLRRYVYLEEIVKLIQIYSEKQGLSWEDGFKKACKILENSLEKQKSHNPTDQSKDYDHMKKSNDSITQ